MRQTDENEKTKVAFDAIYEPAAPEEPGLPADAMPAPADTSHPEAPSTTDESPTKLEHGDATPSSASTEPPIAPTTEGVGLTGTRYEVIRVIGEGGMGIVYLGNQLSPIKRQVAIKVVRKGPEVERFKKRFVNERQALARLDHPHIAQFIDAGQTHGGRPYYVMEYVPGLSITEFADYHQLDLRDRLKLFIQVCEAVAHAHTKAIIHRDLKPSNVLAFMENDVPTTKVIDFGLAKVVQLDEESLHKTKLGAIIGSSYYMSPEQAIGMSDIDTRSDVYSLGVILYELILGAKPHEKTMYPNASELEFLQIISSRPAIGPSSRLILLPEEERERAARRRQVSVPQFARILTKELEWIPLKAMRIERERRYSTADELANDIRRYLDGKALVAGPESWRYVASKWLQKNRTPVVAASIALSLLVSVATVGTVLYFVGANRQRELNQALEAVLNEQNQTDQRLARELSARLAAERQQLLRTGNSDALPMQRLLFPTHSPIRPANARVSEKIFHVPLADIPLHGGSRSFDDLHELLDWLQAEASSNFPSFEIAPFSPNARGDVAGDRLTIAPSLNVAPFVECNFTSPTPKIERVLLFVTCHSDADFDAQVKPSVTLLRKHGFGETLEKPDHLRGTFKGASRIDFQYAPSAANTSWGWITVYPASARD